MTTSPAQDLGFADVPLERWWQDLMRPYRLVSSPAEPHEALLATGVGWEALEEYRDVISAPPSADARIVAAAARLTRALRWLSFEFPQMPLSTAVRWAVLVGHECGGSVAENILIEFVTPWEEAGLGDAGPVYAAAGLSPTETMQGLAAGSLDPQRAAALAGLRGAPLPH